MASLVSPGVSVSIIDESFYVPGAAATVPLFIIATESEKTQADGVTPALGTYEYGVLRVVTSLRQSLELYGVPKYYETGGQQHHGDARNEYGLDALNKYLEIGDRAYVVRANVNLNDNYVDLKALWQRKIEDAADYLNELVTDYIAEYNAANSFFSPVDVGYKTSVNASELKTLLDEALKTVLDFSSFSSDAFKVGFLQDHTVDHPGYQEVVFNTAGGFLQNSDVTGYEEDETLYGATIRVVHESPSGTTNFNIQVEGQEAVTFGQLIDFLNDEFGGLATAEFIAGRLRITSNLDGVTSEVEILEDGPSGTLPLFASLNLFQRFADPVSGTGVNPLTIYNDAFSATVGDYDGLNALIDAWNLGSEVSDEFTGDEAEGLLLSAADDFDNTTEFRTETSLGANDALRRATIVTALQAAINDPRSGIRQEHIEYNVVVTPGYPECTDEMERLNVDMLEEVFVVGETPFDKPPTGPNGINTWAATPARTTSYSVGYWYGHGISSNIDGKDILTTSAATAVRTIAFNDRERDVWWAPAGTSRGNCPHLTSIGYVSGTLGGPTTFVEDFLDRGTRDELYEFPKNINPITFIPGRGILVLGQKTTSPNISALDRINVSRLVKYIKRQLRKALFSYLFEPNDEITRRNVKFAVDNFLLDLVDRRALYDFATVCDLSNNTPVRIDRNELWVDVAIKPVKAIEFIYVPVRIVDTGANIGTGRNIVVGL